MTEKKRVAWTDRELRACVQAYLKLQEQLRNGEQVSRKAIYRQLAERFGNVRSVGSYEFRFLNISHALDAMGRSWLPGLKPASHCGAGVVLKLQALIEALT